MAGKEINVDAELRVMQDAATDANVLTLDNKNASRILIEQPHFIRTAAEMRYYQDCYRRIKENGVGTKTIDTYALGMLAMNMALVETATLSIQNDGFMIEIPTERGFISRKNAAVDVLQQAQNAVKFYLKQFRMTPEARGKEYAAGGADVVSDAFDQL